MLTPTVTPAAGAGSQTASANRSDIGQKDIFLKLLVAQMQNQDPLKPQDPTQMSSQLAQFNMVEQQTKSNQFLEKIAGAGGFSSAGASSAGGASASYLGRTVTLDQNELFYNGSAQNFTIKLNEPAPTARVFIFDSNGNPVRTMSLSNLAAGGNQLTWDGLTDSGAVAAQGNYTIKATATNINGGDVSYTIQRSGIVDAVRFTDAGTKLVVGGVAAPASAIREIRL